jgi:amino acid adenylation domain-containing protein
VDSIATVFEARVRAFPERVALRDRSGTYTYAGLDAAANRLAHYLRHLGVTTGDVVGVSAGRCAETVLMLLAVVKAGAAYLALDERMPGGRRAAILTDASAAIVLTGRGHPVDAGGLPVRVVAIDRVRHLVEEQPSIPPDVALGPEHLAYVAYTSGSTGVPKGVLVPHRGVLRLVIDNDFIDVRADDIFLHFAPVAFDASTLEIWGALLNGATLAVAPPGDVSLHGLLDFVRAERVSVMWLTAGLFHRAVDVGLPELPDVRYLISGGDVLLPAQVARAARALKTTRIVNGYGPTENTTFTACHTILVVAEDRTVPIGRAIRGTEIYLLDERLQPVPHGEVGELYAAGSGLAHGYLNSPGWTAARFVANPFAAGSGERMYRTGDLARRRPDGTFEFIGRRDSQVKVQGFRVELGEVEVALTQLPGVVEAAVVAQRLCSGDRRLTAYVVVSASTTLTGVEIRRQLRVVLPEYAVPAVVRLVDRLPMTASGKVDRAALAIRAVQDRPDLYTAYRPAESPVERAVVELWADQLGIVGIGVDDDFFELGGHSLLAVSVIGSLRADHGVEVSPLDFYENPTPAGLARLVESTGVAR